ncbi:hypothetical protein C1Y63_01335 [Corynebacterium sp. 13CS0277]|uniref:hypothetical protein n=1 Tax=Corynebacterium sp. 13CS0277 TaxID=2071994 RepID=UPI000D027D41|nr:hypothetical protein [Corynebacterium sp. 13CS0277]PRQ12463.1 hypothetical protein C1Y63_01335 [Corynebacterium sp. 13CS0277]
MKKLFAASAAVACAVALAPAAQALPPFGASENTPGTKVTITSPLEIRAGENVSVKVSGFAPNSVVSIKVDDGKGYSNTGVQFTGVVGKVTTNSRGEGTTTFEMPCEIGQRTNHWLRLLNKTDGKMYSHRTGADLYVRGYASHCS